MEDKDYKNIEFENNAIINTAPEELPEEAHNIPQGVRPHLNPNPGYGEDGETKPAIKTVPVKGEVKVDGGVVTPPQVGFKGIQDVYNFLNGILVKGKKLEDYIDSQGGVTEEEMETFVNTFVNNALVADKDVISKITKVYDEENNLTTFNFPIGVMPLSITINTHTLYFKNGVAVNYGGREVEGYTLKEIYANDGESYISFEGNLSEQVINGLVYVNYNSSPDFSLSDNSYYLFFPIKESGTQWYKYTINVVLDDGESHKELTLICVGTINKRFTNMDEEELLSILPVSIVYDQGDPDVVKTSCISFEYTLDKLIVKYVNNTSIAKIEFYDIGLASEITDTVTEL